MSEKVIQSFEIVETDEGFRIEMKGDKELLRKMLFEQGRPFFGGMPFGRGRGFGGHGPFGHRHEHHEHHGHHGHPHEGDEPETFEMEVEPLPEHLRDHLRDQLFFRRRFRRGGWKFQRGGYDMGPWWDEGATPDEQAPV